MEGHFNKGFSMGILINFGQSKEGGGQTVALNFLEELKRQGKLDRFVYLAAKNSRIEEFLQSNNSEYFTTSRSPLIRVFQELFLTAYIYFIHRNII